MDKQAAERILIVDDMPANIKVLGETLKSDYNLSFARSGQKALEIATSHPHDLILLDIMMPEINGYTVCRRLKANPGTRNIPVIFITAKTREEDEAKGFELGAVDYITKPFSPALVLARVRTHLELKRHRDYLEEMIQERTNQLIHSDRLATLGMISAAVAHEVRNPLFFISGSVELIQQSLKEKGSDDEMSGNLERILDGSRRIAKLIDTLRKYSGHDTLQKKKFKLSDIIDDALNLLSYQFKQGGITFVTAVSPDLKLYCDPQKLSQVFVNLLSNAGSAMGNQGGRVTVNAAQADEHLVIRIRDNGPGIDAEDVERIFDPFYTTKGKDEGTGLGLFIVRNIIEDHKGKISLSPFAGRGAEFKISLPIRD